jgi:hypothetical protein
MKHIVYLLNLFPCVFLFLLFMFWFADNLHPDVADGFLTKNTLREA